MRLTFTKEILSIAIFLPGPFAVEQMADLKRSNHFQSPPDFYIATSNINFR